jgi:hypothetical protein
MLAIATGTRVHPKDLPESWYEPQVAFTDMPAGYFVYNGAPTLGLFIRDIPQIAASVGIPMAMDKTGAVYPVTRCTVAGWLRKEFRLELMNPDESLTSIRVPISAAFPQTITHLYGFAKYAEYFCKVTSRFHRSCIGRGCLFIPSPLGNCPSSCLPR